MDIPRSDTPISGSEHSRPADHRFLRKTADETLMTVTLVLRRRPGGPALRGAEAMSADARPLHDHVSRSEFAAAHGADPAELEQVAAFARSHGLDVVETDQARRTVIVRGPAAAMNRAFAVELRDYQSPRGVYRGHEGTVNVPQALSSIVEAVIGLDDRKVEAKHFATARRQNPQDPPNTKSVTPQQIAKLYNFPAGLGTGQTIGIYEMETREGPPGYDRQDLVDTMRALGGVTLPKVIDVAVDGTSNSGASDDETGLDITVAGAIAQGAALAVYFTGGTAQNIVHAVQRMVHPGAGDPVPTILSISYGWGPDDGPPNGLTGQTTKQLSKLFQDAAALGLTVLVSSGDSGVFIASNTQAQTSYPASDPCVTACGGTTLGNVVGTTFDEYVWNDVGKAGPGATGGGISAHFPVPAYQRNVKLPNRLGSDKPGRGVPDIAGNASENSGYPQVINRRQEPVGGTSAVAPLYAGLIAIINSNLGSGVGFINPVIYAAPPGVFRDIAGPPGPSSNAFGKVAGYAAATGWDACTGLGSVDGTALQAALKASLQHPAEPTHDAAGGGPVAHDVFQSGTFRGVAVTDAFAEASLRETPIIVDVGQIPWPTGLAPASVALGQYKPGDRITTALKAHADVLIVLFTEPETSALLGVFTKDNSWTEARRKTWYGYGHNFAKFAPIEGAGGDVALNDGLFGYLSAVKVGTKTVALYKSELHPKQNGSALPFVGVMQQLIQELSPSLVIGTGTAGAIGSHINCGDVAITSRARFRVRVHYGAFPDINTASDQKTELTNNVVFDPKYVQYAADKLTKLSLDGLGQCYAQLQKLPGYGFVRKNQQAPSIYVTRVNPAPAPQPMDIVSADFLTVDDTSNAEQLQDLGIMNDTDDAFLFYAISHINGAKPNWLSIRNASEPQIVVPSFPPGTTQGAVVNKLKGVAGSIYGIYQYCTTLNSAFACWGVVAGL